MALVQGIDGASLLDAFRQGRQDRYENDARQLDLAGKKLAIAKQQQVQGILARYAGGGAPSSGVAGTYAPSNPAAAGGGSSFDAAFSPSTMTTIAQGGTPPPVAPTAAPAAPSGVQGAYASPPMDQSGLVHAILPIDPDLADKMAGTLKNLSDAELKTHQAKNDIMGAASRYLMQFPPAERQAHLSYLLPQLRSAGWSDSEIASADLSDAGLNGYQALALTTDQAIDNALEQKKANEPKIVTPQPGSGAFALDPTTGTVRTLVAPNDGTHAAGASAGASNVPPAAADYLRKNPSLRAQFDEKYGAGAAASVLGGGSGNATGGF